MKTEFFLNKGSTDIYTCQIKTPAFLFFSAENTLRLLMLKWKTR